MDWQRLLGSAVAAWIVAALGCNLPATPLRDAVGRDVTAQQLVHTGDGPAVRLQKPENEPPPPAARGDDASASGQVVAQIRATVNGAPILDSEIREAAIGAMGQILQASVSDRARVEQKVMDGVLDQLIDRELLYQDALAKLRRAGKKDIFDKVKEAADKDFQRWLRTAKTGFKSDDDFKQYLLSMGTSVEGQRRLRERMFIAEEYLRSNVMRHVDRAAGPQEVADYYKSHPEEFTRGDSVQWQDIFVLASKFPSRDEAKRFAEALASQARAGADFVALGKQYDDGLAKDQQGMGIGSERGKVRPPEAEPIVFALKPGEVGPVVELPGGFHVVKVVKRDYAGLVPYDDKVQSAVKDRIRNDVYLKERKRFVDDLRRTALVEKYR